MDMRVTAFFRARAQALVAVLQDLAHAPAGAFLGAAVVAVALALPAGLYGLAVNVQRLTGSWDRGNEVSIYLHRSVTDQAGLRLAAQLAREPEVVAARYVSPNKGLRELARSGHFGDTLALLPHNPLPPVVVLKPRNALSAPNLGAFIAAIRTIPEVATVEADLEWVQRLQAGLVVVRRIGILLAIALALAILVIIGNSARLQILNRRSEIELMKLVGATDGFIRRPFVYTGALQGLFGGMLGWLLLVLGEWALSFPVAHLAHLYGNQFTLHGPGIPGILGLGGAGFVLGWLGARIAVGRHLGDIEPAQS
ncbi:MAG: permease-like cell division protein FtsX [Acidiferrobacteraceae bacterium]